MFVNQGNKATRFGFGEGVVELGKRYPQVVVLGADITASVSLNGFAGQFPNRFFSLGIAEQNVVGVAAGLALTGKIPILSTYGVFAAMRTTDQVRVSVCYNNVKVIIGGAHAGISVGPDGATHQALEDIAVMRSLPNMTVLSPCDANQVRQATIAAVEQIEGPVYIRFGREPVPNFTPENMLFEVGKGQTLTEGNDVAIVATGHMVWEALEASRALREKGIGARVVNIHTIKPLDVELLVRAARETGALVTIEEHQVFGGLGSAVAEAISTHYPVPLEIMGMPDRFGESGKPEELLRKYGLNSGSIVAGVSRVLERKATLRSTP
jgi:transketolase